MLNPDQVKALRFINVWWKSNDMYAILDGAAGTGKTYLLSSVVKELPVKPLILAPTHEALRQLQSKIGGIYTFKTVHSALGIIPTVHEKDIKFHQLRLPSLWNDVALAIVDECSMLSELMLELLALTKTRILFVGHEKQLPPIDVKRKITDQCVAPVFLKNYPTVSLTIPMRNTGNLWDFNNHLAENIYKGNMLIPDTFDIRKTELAALVTGEQGKQELLDGTLKIVLWTNHGVDGYNGRVRNVLFGEQIKQYKYVVGDRIILTAPLNLINHLELYNESGLRRFVGKNVEFLFSNSKGVVRAIENVVVKLNKELHIPCYKLYVEINEQEVCLYEACHKEDIDKMNTFYEHLAWNTKDRSAREFMYKQKHFFSSCFAQIKFFYAATAHRMQGSSIPKVITVYSDIMKNQNKIERNKCLYVACSRAIDNLYFYRGL